MLGAASIISRAVSAPARWPADRGSPLAVAHRPLPSEMMATWMPALFGRVLEPDSIEVKEGIPASLPISYYKLLYNIKYNTPKKNAPAWTPLLFLSRGPD